MGCIHKGLRLPVPLPRVGERGAAGSQTAEQQVVLADRVEQQRVARARDGAERRELCGPGGASEGVGREVRASGCGPAEEERAARWQRGDGVVGEGWWRRGGGQ